MRRHALLLVVLVAVSAGFAVGRLGDSPPVQPPTLESVCDRDLHITWTGRGRDAIWMLPGVRNLEPFAFGNVASPAGAEFMIGVPLYDRLDDGAGKWTTTLGGGGATWRLRTASVDNIKTSVARGFESRNT